MQMALAAVTEAIVVMLGEPDTKNRQCPLAMDKWAKLIVAEEQLGLGLTFNTRKMSVAITRKYLDDTLRMIQTVWFKGSPTRENRKRFTAIQASIMVGKFGRLREGASWVCFLVSQFYSSLAFALAQNKETLTSSSAEFQHLVKQFHWQNSKASFQSIMKHEKIVCFALKKRPRWFTTHQKNTSLFHL